jgi:trehalose 6-phosphate synthase/phosphatase
MSKPRLIIVSNRPPIKVQETKAGLEVKPAPGGLASALSRIHAWPESLWVGWSGLGRRLSLAEFQSLQLGPKLALINLEPGLYRRYYDAFANGSVWPVLHGFDARKMYGPADFNAVQVVTDRFARCVAELAAPDDLIWVHDFQLPLLPGRLRELGLRNRIGFFLHVPFPEPRQFAKLPDHNLIAASVARADVVGFQTPADARRFERYAAAQGLRLAAGQVGAYPIGVDAERYGRARDRPEVARHRQELERRYEGKRVIFSVSRLDYTKGILHQLQAVDGLLAASPRRRDVVYKLVVSPSREDLAEYQEEKLASAALAEAINRSYGDAAWQPVEYEYRNLDFDELVAWYERADIMLVAPLVDGMNLIAKEYVAAHGDDGVLVLSGRAGAAVQLREAVIVEPRDISGVVRGLQRAGGMDAAERRERMRRLREVVEREDVRAWAEGFLRELSKIDT